MRMPLLALMLIGAFAAGCRTAPPEDEGPPAKKLTVGVVQREIHIGMSSAAVAEALGSPNIVTTDDTGCEVWVYDRFAREVRSQHDGYFLVFFYGGDHRASTTTRTLTVLVKFDKDKKVRELAYHATTS